MQDVENAEPAGAGAQLINNNNEDGHAWMIAYAVDTFENQRLIVELLQVTSDRPERTDFGLPAKTNETQIQGSYRIKF